MLCSQPVRGSSSALDVMRVEERRVGVSLWMNAGEKARW